MLYTIPDYYKEFKCIADQCSDTCCAGWGIAIDERALARYRKMDGNFGNRVYNSIDWKAKMFRQYQGKCAFLNEENLCDLYSEAGPQYLCETCRKYPRHVEEFENMREMSLSLSCPVAAKLILFREEPVRFLQYEKERPQEEEEEFDFFLFTKLEDARRIMIQIMQNRKLDYRVRAAMVLSLAHDMQIRIREERLFDMDELLERYTSEHAAERFERKLEPYQNRRAEKYQKTSQMLDMLKLFEVLKKDWPQYVDRAETFLLQKQKQKAEAANVWGEQTALYWEHLMIYFIFTYFCGAVYDERVYDKMKFAVVSTLLIQELDLAYDCVEETARRYAREMEHSDENMETMERMLRENSLFQLESLLICILN